VNKRRFDRLNWVLCTLLLTASHTWGQDLPTAKPEDVGVSAEKVEKLSAFMQSLVDQGKIPGGVTMMARHGKVIHLKAVGMADREEKKRMQTDAIFRIASMTKPITSVAILMLYDQGKLGLDDPVSKYIPEFKNPQLLVSVDPLKTEPADREITIRHLLTHTSGIGYNFTDKIGPIYDQNGITGGLCNVTEVPLDRMMAKLGQLPLLFRPGEKWEYGLSADVLGRVVEKAYGKTLDCCLDEMVFQPLRMKDTFFRIPSSKRSRLAAAYVPIEHGMKRLEAGDKGPNGQVPDVPYNPANSYLSGGGGLCSTVEDYMRFCQMLLDGGELDGHRLLHEETVQMMRNDQTGRLSAEFGFGFTVFPAKENVHEQLRGAYAWFGYWSTSFRISPHGNWALVTMSQVGWNDKETPVWFAEYERIAAEAIEK
jgi:CubicO group peptidase (beta-lactamase class C family)